METLREIWSKLDDQNVALHNALDVLYTMSEAARCEDLDCKRYANAMNFLWEHLQGIEANYAELNESLSVAAQNAPTTAQGSG